MTKNNLIAVGIFIAGAIVFAVAGQPTLAGQALVAAATLAIPNNGKGGGVEDHLIETGKKLAGVAGGNDDPPDRVIGGGTRRVVLAVTAIMLLSALDSRASAGKPIIQFGNSDLRAQGR